MKKDLGSRLKEAREKANFTQQEVADKLNISRQTISKYELNINEPDLETLKSLALLYGADINELLGIKNKSSNSEKSETVNKILLIFNLIVVFISVFASSIIIFKFLPETVPVHYNFEGVVDRYGSKYELLFLNLIFIVILAVYLPTYFLSKSALENEPVNPFKRNLVLIFINGTFSITFLVESILSFYYIFIVSIINSIGKIVSVIFIFMYLFMMTMSFLSNPKINKMNIFVGYRTKFALSCSENWAKLNWCASISLFVFSLISLIISCLFNSIYLCFTVFILLLSIVPPIVFEQYLKKNA